MKKAISSVICLLLVVCLLAQPLPVSAYGKTSKWAASQIAEIDKAGLIPDCLSKADMTLNITREELCKMAVLAYKNITYRNSLTPKKTDYFKDTSDADICLAYELGIVQGYSDGNFGPKDKLTRQELFVIINSLFKSVGWSTDEYQDLFQSFLDSDKVGEWAVEATKIMLELGIVSGTGGNYITPAGNVTIEQALVLLERAYDYARYYQAEMMGPFTGIDPQTLTLPAIPSTHCYTACSSWAKTAVGYMEGWKLIPDCLKKKDFTAKNITRLQFCEAAVLCYRSLTGDTSNPTVNYFKDTTNAAVNKAYELMIVSGYSDNTFRPAASISRQEMFAMILRFMQSIGWEQYDNTYELQHQFTDWNSTAQWAQEAATTVIKLDIVKGDGSSKLLPLDKTSREQAAILFYRAYRYISLWYSSHPLDPDTYPGHIVTDNPNAQMAVDLAYSKLGCRYVYATQGPNTFDCSGLVYWIYHTQLGYSMGRTATAQWKNGVQVTVDWKNPSATMKPGDLVYFRSSPGSSSIGHIGIYVGPEYNGEKTPYGQYSFIHASNSKTGVIWGDLHSTYYQNNRIYGVRRIAY